MTPTDDKQTPDSSQEGHTDEDPLAAAKAKMAEEEKGAAQPDDGSKSPDGKSEEDSSDSSEKEEKPEESSDEKQSRQDEDKASEKATEEDGGKKIDKATAHFQETMRKASEKLFNTNKRLVEKNPAELISLANSNDDKDVKMAKKLAKEVYDMELSAAIEQIKKVRKEEGEEEETTDEIRAKVTAETTRKVRIEAAQKSFIAENKILDEKSEEYNRDVKEKFEKKFSTMTDGKDILPEDMEEHLNDALTLAQQGLEKKAAEKEGEDAQKQIGSAGGSAKNKNAEPKKDENPFRGMEKVP